MKFLIFIFWCVVFFYVAGLVGRLLIRGYVDRRMKEFSSGQSARNERAARQSRKREGEVRIQRIGRVEKRVESSVGEYVEYEEVKEEK